MTGPELKAARALRGWTQQDLADRVGVGVTTIVRMEGGRQVLPVIADAVARVLSEPFSAPESTR